MRSTPTRSDTNLFKLLFAIPPILASFDRLAKLVANVVWTQEQKLHSDNDRAKERNLVRPDPNPFNVVRLKNWVLNSNCFKHKCRFGISKLFSTRSMFEYIHGLTVRLRVLGLGY